jgi:hypothetical protein
MKQRGAVFSRRLAKVKAKRCVNRYDVMKVLRCSYPAAGVYLAALRAEQVEKEIIGNDPPPSPAGDIEALEEYTTD